MFRIYTMLAACMILGALAGCKPADTPVEQPETVSVPADAGAPSVDAADAANTAGDVTDVAPATIVGKEAYDAFIASTPIAVVDFSATWCGPCQALAPYLEKMAKTYADSGVKAAKADVDQNRELAQELQIESIPDVRVYVNGTEVARTVGNKPLEIMNNLEDAVQSLKQNK